MSFEELPTTPRAEELLDTAFSRATRAGRAKSGVDAQQSMLRTATNVLHDNLAHVVHSWPDLSALDPAERELAGAVLRRTYDADGDRGQGVNALRHHLGALSWAAETVKDVGREYEGRVEGDVDTARKHRKQAFARLANIVEDVESDLQAVADAREALGALPDIRAEDPAIVVAGYPNVGKSSFVNHVTAAHNETAGYPFTTTGVHLGHLEVDHITYQLVDTPGLLDRPAAERNDVEQQAVTALTHVADGIVFIVDASEACGYPLADQLALRDEVADRFDVPVVTVCNKADRSRDVTADYYMSVTEDENVDTVVAAVVDAIGYEPELPYEE
ncbi:MAG: NOG1 family protein [Halobacteriaceae archaeon]